MGYFESVLFFDVVASGFEDELKSVLTKMKISD